MHFSPLAWAIFTCLMSSQPKKRPQLRHEVSECSKRHSSSFVKCPICSKQVPSLTINFHVDECLSKFQAAEAPEIRDKGGCKETSHAPSHLPYEAAKTSQQKQNGPSACDPTVKGSDAAENSPMQSKWERVTSISSAMERNLPQQGETTGRGGACDWLRKRPDVEMTQVQLCASMTCMGSAHRKLPGQWLFEGFVTEAEEAQLMHMLDTQPPLWRDKTFNGKQRGKAWGVVVDLMRRTVGPAQVPLPPLLLNLADRMRMLPALAGFHPNEANALDYRNGVHVLYAHADDRQLSTEVICTVSLCGSAVMTFSRPRGPAHEVRVPLPPRSIQVLSKDARYSYTHAIHAEDILSPRRISITFRHSPLTA